MADPAAIDAEINRALAFLAGLENHTVDVVTVTSPAPSDATVIARNISKLSPLVSNLIESKVVNMVAEDLDPAGSFDWRRQDPGWPDAGLFDGGALVGGFEVKAWYVLATEMTSRFRAAQSAIAGKRGYVVVVPWVMSHVVYGQPVLLGHHVVDALELAAARDARYHNPPSRIVVEPADDPDRAKNLQQTNVMGEKLQNTNPDDIKRAKLIAERFAVQPIPHDEVTRELNRLLIENFRYRTETNFGKLHRIHHPQLEAYEKEVLAQTYRDLTFDKWRQMLKVLRRAEDDPDDVDADDLEKASKKMEELYVPEDQQP